MAAAIIPQKTNLVLGVIRPLVGRMAPTGAFTVPGDLNERSRVLVIDSGDLTEVLFFSPVLEYLKSLYPGMRVTYLVREGNSELVRTMGHVNEMISYESEHLSLGSTTYFSLVRRIRERDFGVVFLLGSEFNIARSVLALVTRAKIRVGFSGERSYPFINCEMRVSDENAYEAKRVRNLLKVLGVNGVERLPEWELPDQDRRWAKQMIHFHKPEKGAKLVAVDPGIGKGSHRLVEASFAYLVNQLARRMDCRILVISNNLDRKHLEHFRRQLDGDLLDLEPKNVKEGLALLSGADLFVSGNTDFFHFAVNMRVPTVGLFTRHDTANWIPKGTPWVQILQGASGQQVSVEEFVSKIDTLLHLARTE